MALTTDDRRRVARGLMRHWSRVWEATGFSEPELSAAIGATDDWIDGNQASYNTALPDAFRTGATLAQKTMLFCAVAAMRVGLAFARALFGEVD